MATRISQLATAATLTGNELVELSQLSASVTKTATTISADSADNSFNDSGNGFVTAGFTAGKSVKVSGFTGSAANNIVSGVVTPVAAGKIISGGTDGDVIVTDAAGESVTITQWDSRRSTAQDVADLAGVSTGRETLSASRTYYVRTDGSDSNNGLANTAGGAFLTIQKACDVVCSIDMATYQVTVQVADGTYTTPVILRSYLGALPPLITGNTGTPANCIINTTSAACITCSTPGAYWTISGLKLTTTTGGTAISLNDCCKLGYENINFGAVAGTYSSHIYLDRGAIAVASGDYSITGGAFAHLWPNYSAGVLISGKTITITGTPAFSGAFLYSRVGWLQADTTTYSGSATGKRYEISLNAVAFTNAGALPGSLAGTASTGAVYA